MKGGNLELVLVKKGEGMEGTSGVTSARYQAQTSTSDDDLLVSSSVFTCATDCNQLFTLKDISLTPGGEQLELHVPKI